MTKPLYLHRSRFVDYTPSSITALAFSHPSNLSTKNTFTETLRLAIGRSNGDIEIWHPRADKVWFHETTLKGGADRSIEGLAWTQDPREFGGRLRLFSIGQSAYITEWDLAEGKPKKHMDCNGAIIWSISAQPRKIDNTPSKEGEEDEIWQNLVVGVDDGSVIVVGTNGGPGHLSYVKTLTRVSAKSGGRVLSLTWQGRYKVVAGLADSTIRVWDLRSGQIVQRMSLGREITRGKNVLIWAVKVLKNGDIVCGTSAGEVLFWNGKNYTLMQRLRGHESDVLCLETNAAGDMVFAAGIDMKTVVYHIAGGESRKKWAELGHRRYHQHDVRAMAAYEGGDISVLVSGGMDMQPVTIPIRNFLTENHRKLAAIPQRPVAMTVPEERLLMTWYEHEVKIWEMDHILDVFERDEMGLGLENEENGRKLVSRIVINNEENITSASLSPLLGAVGHLVVISTIGETKLFFVRRSKKPSVHALRVNKIPIPTDLILKNVKRNSDDSDNESENEDEEEAIDISAIGARFVQFSPDGKWLLVIAPDSRILLVRINVEIDESLRPSVNFEPIVVELERVPRKEIIRPETKKRSHETGNHGEYKHTIVAAAFSSGSRILAITDIEGWVDSYLYLEDEEDQTADGQWVVNPAAEGMPRLESTAAVMEFRPATAPTTKLLFNSTNSTTAPLVPDDDRLAIALASPQSILEFHVLTSKLTPWSRRNPSEHFPNSYKRALEVPSGIVWDLPVTASSKSLSKERLWVWSANWLWMFDLSRDLPIPPPLPSSTPEESTHGKRKRGSKNPTALTTTPQAGFLIGKSKSTNVDARLPAAAMKTHSQNSGAFIRPPSPPASGEGEGDVDGEAMDLDPTTPPVTLSATTPHPAKQTVTKQSTDNQNLPYWHTFKYRPLMGFFRIGNRWSEEGTKGGDINLGEKEDGEEDWQRCREMVVLERPMWDIDLGPRFYGKRDWRT